MLGPDARSVLQAALSPLPITSLRLRQVLPRPGSSLAVAWDAVFDHPDREVRMVVAQAGGHPPHGATLVSDGSERIAVWVYPADPALPGLSALFDPSRRDSLLAQVDAGGGPVEMSALSYRPGRRAVVEVRTSRSRLFAKAVRPTVVGGIQARHRLLAPVVRVPASLGWSEEAGLVLLEPLAGRTLLETLQGSGDGIAGGAILEILDRLPSYPSPVVSPVQRLAERAWLLRRLVPDLAGVIHTVVDGAAQVAPEPSVGVHGDMHAGQIMIDDRGDLALVDIDSAGSGCRSDDLAGLLAHLAAGGGANRYIEALVRAFDRRVDPSGLRRRTAAALLGFATVPFVNQEPDWPAKVAARVLTAARWLPA